MTIFRVWPQGRIAYAPATPEHYPEWEGGVTRGETPEHYPTPLSPNERRSWFIGFRCAYSAP
jgi:hypothetical protein